MRIRNKNYCYLSFFALQTAFFTINTLEKKEKDLEIWKSRLAEHFCEDISTFKLEDCFNILFKFCEKIKFILQVCFIKYSHMRNQT